MTSFYRSLSLALMLAVPAGLTQAVLAPPAFAQIADQTADPAAAQIQGFYDVLVAAMKMGGTAKARYEKLKPAIDKAFDLKAMTAMAVGPSFATMSDADKTALVDAFTSMIVANYAKNFDSYHGEKFPVEPKAIARGSEYFVKSSAIEVISHYPILLGVSVAALVLIPLLLVASFFEERAGLRSAPPRALRFGAIPRITRSTMCPGPRSRPGFSGHSRAQGRFRDRRPTCPGRSMASTTPMQA